MPAPVAVGVYVLAAVGSVAAGLAFKEFVYEPHIAPRVERWAEEFLAKRRAKKMRKAGLAAVPVSANAGGDAGTDAGDADNSIKSTYELESLVANEVRQWRSQVDVGRGEGTSTLRHRRNVGSSSTMSALDESNIIIPYDAMTPTHILFDPADGLSVSASSPTSTMASRVPTPSPHSTLSHSTFRMPPPAAAVQAPPTPEPSVSGSPIAAASPAPALATPVRSRTPQAQTETSPYLFSISSPHHVPSLSLSYPLDLDSEHDLELLSAPSSSRPSSPFSDSDFSSLATGTRQHEREQFHSFTLSPASGRDRDLRLLSASTSEAGSEAGDGDGWSNAGSEVSSSSWASADVQRR
ncbi:hypothetical protein B0H19DRAFT_1191758 [Mycena capillaripes]|nr:hypothetical protein B0H19DRAFT_1191758 [Mycena capillaripes]